MLLLIRDSSSSFIYLSEIIIAYNVNTATWRDEAHLQVYNLIATSTKKMLPNPETANEH